MHFNPKALLTSGLLSLLSVQDVLAAPHLALRQENPSQILKHRSFDDRDKSMDVKLTAIRDMGELTGKFSKRALSGAEAFDPTSRGELFWGAYVDDHIVTANMTIGADQDQMFLLIENFAQRLKSIKCGPDVKGATLTFNDKADFDLIEKKWKWIDEKDLNRFILVTEMDQCYKGDDRSPYDVKGMTFDKDTLTVNIDGAEVPWDTIKNGVLHVTNEYVDPKTVSQTHPQLIRRESKSIDLKMDKSITLFEWKKDSKESAGLGIKANVHMQTAGAILADIGIAWGGFLDKIPQGFTADFKPKALEGTLILDLELDGKLGKEINWDAASVDIPVGGFTVAKVFEVGPIAGIGVHFGSTAIEGKAHLSVGAKAKIPDNAVAHFESKDTGKNKVEGWKPEFSKVDPRISAEVKASLKAWADLSFKVKASALSFGFEAGVVAELPYFEASAAVKVDTSKGVCDSKKAMGIELNTEVGINVDLELDVGKLDGDPTWGKNLFHTQWDLYKTCIGVGKDIQTTSVADIPDGPGKTKTSSGDKPSSTSAKTTGSDKPSGSSATVTKSASETGKSSSKASSASITGSSKSESASASKTSSKASGSSAASESKSSGSSAAPGSSSKAPSSSATKTSSGSVSESTKASSSGAASSSKASSSGAASSSKASSSAAASSTGAASSSKASSSAAASSSKAASSGAASSSAAASATSSGSPEPSGNPTYSTSPTAPKYDGASTSCKKYYSVKAGEDCSNTGLSTPDLVKLNKGLQADCNNLMSGIAYCVEA